MKLLKRHKVAASSAVLALVLYSGWATITSSDGDTRIDAPKGVYLDEAGAHTFDTKEGASAGDLLAAARRGADGQDELDGSAEGFLPAGAFWSEEDQVVKFRIRGEAFDADTGEPLDAFELTATPTTSKDFAQSSEVKRRFTELKNGQFLVGGMGLGTWRVRATREGYAPVIQTLEIADLRATPYLVIPLSSSGAQLSGRVIDWRGKPVADAKIGLADCAESKKKVCNLVTSDVNGHFTLDKLPEEEVYALYAKHERYGISTTKNLRSMVDEEGAGQHITIRLSGVLRIYGRVMKGNEDQPVANALVAGGGGETRSSATGDYELTVPLEEHPEAHVASYPGSAARVAIHSYPQDRSVRPLEWVDAPTHAAQVRIDFHLEMSGASLVGTILDRSGKPQAGLEVQLVNTNGWKPREHQTFPTLALTDEAGNYRVDHIPAGAGYMLRYRQSESEDWNSLGYVNIQEETEVRADFQVGSAAIRGRFVAADTGEPIYVADMSCSRLGAEKVGARDVFMLAHCYPDGRFEIVNLMPGSYELHSKTEWMDSTVKFKSKTVDLLDAQVLRDVEIEVEGAGAKHWRFRILSEDNEFLAGAYIRYRVGNSLTTANLQAGDDGISQQQIDSSIDEIFLEVPGYEPAKLKLKSLDPIEVQEVHLERISEQ